MNFDRLHSINKLNILVFGDFMVDQYIIGNVNRISPEAPVPILEVENKYSRLGGAGNVINNLVHLGANVRAMGYFGNDQNGTWIREELEKAGVDTGFLVLLESVQTIVKTRLISKNQQFLRLDEEIIADAPDCFYEFTSLRLKEIFKDIVTLIISDYGKGTVTERLCKILIDYANINNIPVIVDPKGTNYSKYRNVTVCTPNTKELLNVYNSNDSSENIITKYGQALCEDLNLEYLVLTRSEKGISLFSKSKDITNFPVVKKDVIDVTGAGDTVVAMLSVSYSLGFSINDSCKLANIAASIVCSKSGAATLTVNELFDSINKSGEFKFIDVQSARYLSQMFKDRGKKVVFTNGCFDLLHAGHLSSLLQAKSFGDILIVAVNSDASIRRIKGEKRPIIDEKNRIALISSLECVDYVVLLEENTPIDLIRIIEPSISVKGRDWENKYIPEKEIIESYGGRMEFIDLKTGLSTTNIINKILDEKNVE